MNEFLTQYDPLGDYVPMLATSWEASPDMKTWRLKLRKGVPFHYGWGDFTAKDITHSIWRLTREGSIATNAALWQELAGKGTEEEIKKRVEVVSDHEVVFRLPRAEPELHRFVSNEMDLNMVSKAQWDKEGLPGVLRRSAGTGPYRLVERASGAWVLYERVDNHWRIQPPFKELQVFLVPESSTRLAMLLAGETHVADIPADLQSQAAAKGMKVIPTTVPSVMAFMPFGGNYLPTKATYDPAAPLTKKEVRRALNKAINRKELQEKLFGGKGEFLVAQEMHPSLPGWDPNWVDRFPEMYGYNPAAAKQLLAQAGYPTGFKLTLRTFPRPGVPQLPDVAEAIALYWKAIGVDVKLEPIEFARHREEYRLEKLQGIAFTFETRRFIPWDGVRLKYLSNGVAHFYESQFLEEKFAEFQKTLDPKERDRLQREMGNHLFEQYATAPLFWLFGELVVNPQVVADLKTTGVYLPRDLEYVRATQ
jgi:ABC-type transport system substrate-binding protein